MSLFVYVVIAADGILLDLIREGQGIVANGKLDENGIFQAKEVLAKYGENYMPPEVAEALEITGANNQYGQYKQKQ